MKFRIPCLVAVVALIASSLGAANAASPAGEDVLEATLANGLRVVIVRNELAPTTQAELQSGSPELRLFFRDLPVVNLAYVRPQQQLPADIAAFDRQDKLDETFAIGEADGARGFTAYKWNTFRL